VRKVITRPMSPRPASSRSRPAPSSRPQLATSEGPWRQASGRFRRGTKLERFPGSNRSARFRSRRLRAQGKRLKPIFKELALDIHDVGVHEEKPADYPDIARQVAEIVARGQAARACYRRSGLSAPPSSPTISRHPRGPCAMIKLLPRNSRK